MPDENRDASSSAIGWTRRNFWRLPRLPVPGAAGAFAAGLGQASAGKAQIAITLDLEMSRNFPDWDDTHWDYEKGNLNEQTKHYTVEACRRVKSHGGVLHAFASAASASRRTSIG